MHSSWTLPTVWKYYLVTPGCMLRRVWNRLVGKAKFVHTSAQSQNKTLAIGNHAHVNFIASDFISNFLYNYDWQKRVGYILMQAWFILNIAKRSVWNSGKWYYKQRCLHNESLISYVMTGYAIAHIPAKAREQPRGYHVGHFITLDWLRFEYSTMWRVNIWSWLIWE